jgi:dGTPase
MQANSRFFDLNNDFRDPFARDRDRILHSANFRKLEYKTQVFLNQEGDFFRTRLTHSLEVSQIARAITKELGLREDLSEAIALAHDLGHTPFGHVGGDTLDELLKEAGHKNGFEHNFQSFRVVSKLEKRYAQFDGLNLTFATLEGILKHSYPYKKAFLPTYIAETFNLAVHPSIEAMIVDRADEIAYISHDIQDGINAGLIDFDLLSQSSLVKRILKMVDDEGVDQSDSEIFLYRFSSHFINNLVYSLLDYSKDKLPLVSQPINAKDSLPIGFEKELETDIKKLKKILFQELYEHTEVARKMYAGKECIRGLFKAFYSDINLLPKKEKLLAKSGRKHRVVADYIASLSDRYALKLYNELYGRL